LALFCTIGPPGNADLLIGIVAGIGFVSHSLPLQGPSLPAWPNWVCLAQLGRRRVDRAPKPDEPRLGSRLAPPIPPGEGKLGSFCAFAPRRPDRVPPGVAGHCLAAPLRAIGLVLHFTLHTSSFRLLSIGFVCTPGPAGGPVLPCDSRAPVRPGTENCQPTTVTI
jgi:hypothetical protein